MKQDKIIDILKNLILDVVIIILIIAIIVGTINRKHPVSIFGYYLFTVTTGSMENTLHVNDCIIVKRTSDFKTGDIVTYKSDNSYVTHRIVEINDDYVVTKGDANAIADPEIEKSQIKGKLVKKSNFLTILAKYKIIVALILAILFVTKLLVKNVRKMVIKSA